MRAKGFNSFLDWKTWQSEIRINAGFKTMLKLGNKMIITVKDGQLWDGTTRLKASEADIIARKNGFFMSENLIEAFSDRGLLDFSFEVDETGFIVSKIPGWKIPGV